MSLGIKDTTLKAVIAIDPKHNEPFIVGAVIDGHPVPLISVEAPMKSGLKLSEELMNKDFIDIKRMHPSARLVRLEVKEVLR